MTETQTVDLASWLTRIWDEEERLARAAPGRQWKAFVMDDVAGASVYDEQWVLLYPHHYDHDIALSAEPGATGPMYIERARDELCAHIAAHDPASVLARIAADRKILERIQRITDIHRDGSGSLGELSMVVEAKLMLHDLASPYKGREGWQEEWG